MPFCGDRVFCRLKALFKGSAETYGGEAEWAEQEPLLPPEALFREQSRDGGGGAALAGKGMRGRAVSKGVDQKLLELCQAYAVGMGLHRFNPQVSCVYGVCAAGGALEMCAVCVGGWGVHVLISSAAVAGRHG